MPGINDDGYEPEKRFDPHLTLPLRGSPLSAPGGGEGRGEVRRFRS